MKSENKIGLQKDKNEVEIKIILVFKYIIMAIIVGIVVGIIDTIFGRGLIEISDFRNKNYKFLLPFLPIAGLFITWMYHKFNELSLKGFVWRKCRKRRCGSTDRSNIITCFWKKIKNA